MKSTPGIFLIAISLGISSSWALPSFQKPVQIEVLSDGLKAKVELSARARHYEMTVRMNDGRSQWKQVHRQDAENILKKLNQLRLAVGTEPGNSDSCVDGWIRSSNQQPTTWTACLDPQASTSVLGKELAGALESLVTPDAPVVIRKLALNEEPAALIDESLFQQIEAEVEQAEDISREIDNENAKLEVERQARLKRTKNFRDPFAAQKKVLRPARSVQKPKRVPASVSPAVRVKPKKKKAPARNPKAAVEMNAPRKNALHEETLRLEQILASIEKYQAESRPAVPAQSQVQSESVSQVIPQRTLRRKKQQVRRKNLNTRARKIVKPEVNRMAPRQKSPGQIEY